MPNSHPRPWRRDSMFGDGPRRAFDREQRARFRYLLNAHRRARRLTPCGELVGEAMVRRLGVDGRCDPAHETIAGDVGCSARTVRRALGALKALGLVIWQRRLVRAGWRVSQTSNAYCLALGDVAVPVVCCGGQKVREILKKDSNPMARPDLTREEALKGLAAIAAGRMRKLGLGLG